MVWRFLARTACGRNGFANPTMARQGRVAALLFASVLVSGAVSWSSGVFGAAERRTVPMECRVRPNIPVPLAVASRPVEITQPRTPVSLAAVQGIDPDELEQLPAEAQLFLVLKGLRAEAVGILYAFYIGGSDGAPAETQYLDAFNFFDLTMPSLSLNVTGKRDLVLASLRGGALPLVILMRPLGRNAAGALLPRATVETIELVAQCRSG